MFPVERPAEGLVPLLEQLPADLAKKDKDSRERWAVACYLVLLKQMSTEAIFTLLAGGKDHVLGVLKNGFRGHDLRDSDFEAIYRRLVNRCRQITERTGGNPIINGRPLFADRDPLLTPHSERDIIIEATEGARRPLRG